MPLKCKLQNFPQFYYLKKKVEKTIYTWSQYQCMPSYHFVLTLLHSIPFNQDFEKDI